MEIVQVNQLSDNYAFIVYDKSTKEGFVVDCSQAKPVHDQIKKLGVKVEAILTTHHHGDHCGGNADLVKLLGGKVPVYGGDERIQARTDAVTEGSKLAFGALRVYVRQVPCHTTGHVLYHVNVDNAPMSEAALFTGDTLFIGGCGRFFEGTAAQMHHALNEVIAAMDENTRIFCGHEYTVANLTFAQYVEPNNEAITKKLAWAKSLRDKGKSTLPSRISEEKTFNPFMRVHHQTIRDAVKATDDDDIVEVMRKLRELKNAGV